MNIQQFILSSLKVKIAFLWVFFFRKEKKIVTPHFYMKKYSHYSLLNHSSLSYVHLRVLSSALINKQVTNSTVTGHPSAVSTSRRLTLSHLIAGLREVSGLLLLFVWPEAKNGSYIFNCWKKVKSSLIFCLT